MGGMGATGPVSSVSSLQIPGYARAPRALSVPSLPRSMTAAGPGATLSLYMGGGLVSCSPGYQLPSLTVPGTCSRYQPGRGGWQSISRMPQATIVTLYIFWLGDL